MKLITEVKYRIKVEMDKKNPDFDLLRVDMKLLETCINMQSNPKNGNEIFIREHVL